MQEETLKLEELRNGWLEQIPVNISISNMFFNGLESDSFLKQLVANVRKANNRFAKNMVFSSPKEVFEFIKSQHNDTHDIKKIHEFFNVLGLTSTSIFKYVSYKLDNGYFIFSKPPTFLSIDEEKRLHCTNDYAIYFKDGFGLHYVHGIFFSNELFEKFFKLKNYDGKDILKLENVEQRAVLIQAHGYKKILEEVGAEVIDTYIGKSKITGKEIKYELLKFMMNSIHLKLVRVEDHTTHKIVLLGVPNNIKTCMSAIAWTFSIDEQDYILYRES